MAAKNVNLTAYTNVPFVRDGILVARDPNKPFMDPPRLEDLIPISLSNSILEAGFADEKERVIFTCSTEVPESGLVILEPEDGRWGWRIPTIKYKGYAGRSLRYDLTLTKNGVKRRLWGGAFTVIRGYAGTKPPG